MLIVVVNGHKQSQIEALLPCNYTIARRLEAFGCPKP